MAEAADYVSFDTNFIRIVCQRPAGNVPCMRPVTDGATNPCIEAYAHTCVRAQVARRKASMEAQAVETLVDNGYVCGHACRHARGHACRRLCGHERGNLCACAQACVLACGADMRRYR